MAALLASQQKTDFSSKRAVAVGSASRIRTRNCSPQTEKAFASSLKKSLLSLVLVASFFQQNVDRCIHFSSVAQNYNDPATKKGVEKGVGPAYCNI